MIGVGKVSWMFGEWILRLVFVFREKYCSTWVFFVSLRLFLCFFSTTATRVYYSISNLSAKGNREKKTLREKKKADKSLSLFLSFDFPLCYEQHHSPPLQKNPPWPKTDA
jgi:hypothetical protein